MDLRMPGMDGATAIRQLAERQIPSRVLVLTTYDSDTRRRAGDRGRGDGLPAQGRAARRALPRGPRGGARRIRARPSVATRLVSQLRNPAAEALSERELEVLSLIAQGETNRGAAARLFISEATVKTHLVHIYAKLERQRPGGRRRDGLRARPVAHQSGHLTQGSVDLSDSARG